VRDPQGVGLIRRGDQEGSSCRSGFGGHVSCTDMTEQRPNERRSPRWTRGTADNLRRTSSGEKAVYSAEATTKTGAPRDASDAVTNQRIDETYRLGGEPESCRSKSPGQTVTERAGNVKKPQSRWRTQDQGRFTLADAAARQANLAMAFDEIDPRLFVGTHAARFVWLVFDTDPSGRMIAALQAGQGSDDLVL